jgi:hypothetical protein
VKLTKRFEIRLDPELYAELKAKAASLGVGMSAIVRPGIQYAIKLARKEN